MSSHATRLRQLNTIKRVAHTHAAKVRQYPGDTNTLAAAVTELAMAVEVLADALIDVSKEIQK